MLDYIRLNFAICGNELGSIRLKQQYFHRFNSHSSNSGTKLHFPIYLSFLSDHLFQKHINVPNDNFQQLQITQNF